MHVRYANREELEQVNAIRRSVHALHAAGRPDVFRADFSAALRTHVYEQFDREDAGVIVACEDGKIFGFAVAEYIDRPGSAYNRPRRYYHVEEFGVDEAYRRRGVARALVEFMKRDAVQRGFEKIELDVWQFNEGALAFYAQAGFRTYRQIMELPLQSSGDYAPASEESCK